MLRVATLFLMLFSAAPAWGGEASPTMALGLRGGGGFEFYNHGPVAGLSATGQGMVALYLTRHLAVGALLQHHYLSDFDGICGPDCSEFETVADLVVVLDMPVQHSDDWSFKMAVGAGYRRHVKEVSGSFGYTWVNQGIDLLRFDVAAEYALTDSLRLGPWFTWASGVFLSGKKVFNNEQTPSIKTDWGVPDLLSIQLGLAVSFVF